MTTLYGNPFLNYALLSLIDIPAHLVSWFSAKYFPRRVSFIVFSLLGALALFLIQITLHSKWGAALNEIYRQNRQNKIIWGKVNLLPKCLKITCFTPHKLKVLLLPSEYHNITLTLVLIGKFGVLASESILQLLTGELSPTVIRNTMLSSAALFSRAGSCITPYILQLGEIFGITITPFPPQQKKKKVEKP